MPSVLKEIFNFLLILTSFIINFLFPKDIFALILVFINGSYISFLSLTTFALYASIKLDIEEHITAFFDPDRVQYYWYNWIFDLIIIIVGVFTNNIVCVCFYVLYIVSRKTLSEIITIQKIEDEIYEEEE